MSELYQISFWVYFVHPEGHVPLFLIHFVQRVLVVTIKQFPKLFYLTISTLRY
jgi:hypothetical protein